MTCAHLHACWEIRRTSRNIGHTAAASVCVWVCSCMLYSEDILADPQNFKGLFEGLRPGFNLRLELGLGSGLGIREAWEWIMSSQS